MLKISRALALTLLVSASIATTTHASEREKLIQQRLAARNIPVTTQTAQELAKNQTKIQTIVQAYNIDKTVTPEDVLKATATAPLNSSAQDLINHFKGGLLTPAEQAAKTYLTTNGGGHGGLGLAILNPTKEQIKAATLLIAGGIVAPDNDDLNAGVKCLAVGINAPSDEEYQGALHLTTTLGVANPSKDQINGAAAFIAGGDANPLQAEIDGWVNNVGTRAERVLVAAVGLDSTDAGLIAAATRCVAVGIAAPNANQLNAAHYLMATLAVPVAAPTANQINGAVAFIAGGDATPLQAEIDGWVANNATRAERVLVGAAGLDATDAGLIAAATRCVAVGIAAPNANQLNAVVYLRTNGGGLGAAVVANPSRNRINAAVRIINDLATNNPTLLQIDAGVSLMTGGAPLADPSLNEINAVVVAGPGGRVAAINQIQGNGVAQVRIP